MRPPIYEPKGKAKEYGDLAVNIYTGCPHHCYYCFAPNVLHQTREAFHSNVQPRPGIVEEVKKQLEKEQITGKLIHLCFTCDPFPMGVDTTPTLEIIQLLKEHGNHIQLLTKGDARPAIPLLDGEDWFGITISCMGDIADVAEPGAAPAYARLFEMGTAKRAGVKTWISFEPVLCPEDVLTVMEAWRNYIDKVKIGKLNYHPSDIDWKAFGLEADELCKQLGLDHYIKDSLRAEMEK